ncbi:hypothetical protein XENOCAPTIV_026290 [Xenoophorus captivus]|uniref:Uncharacterized protein n=1 Tax=Xenoophorus captivus TaxID=1517983 RepID=A0ABV0QUD3_9TELE
MKTPPSASLRVKRKNVRQIRKHFCLSRANGQDPDGSLWKIQPGLRDVMAIVPSHFVWQRQRSDHHSGALRQYNEQGAARLPRGPSASPVSCALCNFSSRFHRICSGRPTAQTSGNSYLNPFAPAFTFELTPPRVPNRTTEEDTTKAQKSCCFCPEELPSKRLFHFVDSFQTIWLQFSMRKMAI